MLTSHVVMVAEKGHYKNCLKRHKAASQDVPIQVLKLPVEEIQEEQRRGRQVVSVLGGQVDLTDLHSQPDEEFR